MFEVPIMSYVIVTDGRSRASVPIIRSLGRRGIKIISGDSLRICSSFFSKYTKKRIIYPDPDKYPEEFVSYMLDYVRKNDVEMIIPVRDGAAMALSKYKEELSKYTAIPLADYKTMSAARDKAQTMKIAEDIGIPHPRTEYSTHPNFSQINSSFVFPLVVKPRESSGSRGIVYVDSPQDLEKTYNEVSSKYGPSMIQEYIPYGGAYGVSMLFREGKQKAFFTHKRLREYPPSGGPSTLRESVRHPIAEKYASDLLKHMKWHGVAMCEFRVDSRDNVPKLMEINPRFWGSLSLAIFAGVDFPYLLYNVGLGNDVESVSDYRLNVRTRWLLMGDILWFLKNPEKLKALPEFMKFRDKDLGYDIESFEDPLPAIGAILEAAVSLTKKDRRTHAFNRGWKDKKEEKR
jgi:predicted ATP-grasp superfamily ATP-dependent carboligase